MTGQWWDPVTLTSINWPAMSQAEIERLRESFRIFIDSLSYQYPHTPKEPARKTSKHKVMDYKDWEDPRNITASKGVAASMMLFENMPQHKTVILAKGVHTGDVQLWAAENYIKVKYFQDVKYQGEDRKACVLKTVQDAVAFRLRWDY